MERLTILFTILLLSFLPCSIAQKKGDIVILYDNDVHCAIDGYAKISALRIDNLDKTPFVAVVSGGDYIQGAAIGSFSKGEYPLRVMTHVGYDAVALGNHEFDYGVDHLIEMYRKMDPPFVCCNFIDTTGSLLFRPYIIKRFGRRNVAFIGITTPNTTRTATPSFFYDKQGRPIYTFCRDNFYTHVQSQINQARKEGADYIVLLCHLGINDEDIPFTSPLLIANTYGADIVIDGHSHSYIPGQWIDNCEGKPVLLTSSSSSFSNIGKVIIPKRGKISSELIPLKQYNKADSASLNIITQVKSEQGIIGNRTIGSSMVTLPTKDENNDWIVRGYEASIGNFCADAFRVVSGSDIAMVNGGSIRASIEKGDITYNNLLNVLPYNNMVCKGMISGQQLLDVLEFSVSQLPGTFGGFLHVSGLSYSVDTSITSPVVFNNQGQYDHIEGVRRVRDVKIIRYNPDQSIRSIEPVDPDSSYSLSCIEYIALSHGDGNTAMQLQNIEKTHQSDLEMLEHYIIYHLPDQVIPSSYSQPSGTLLIK